jgi:hypothetical protein
MCAHCSATAVQHVQHAPDLMEVDCKHQHRHKHNNVQQKNPTALSQSQKQHVTGCTATGTVPDPDADRKVTVVVTKPGEPGGRFQCVVEPEPCLLSTKLSKNSTDNGGLCSSGLSVCLTGHGNRAWHHKVGHTTGGLLVHVLLGARHEICAAQHAGHTEHLPKPHALKNCVLEGIVAA